MHPSRHCSSECVPFRSPTLLTTQPHLPEPCLYPELKPGPHTASTFHSTLNLGSRYWGRCLSLVPTPSHLTLAASVIVRSSMCPSTPMLTWFTWWGVPTHSLYSAAVRRSGSSGCLGWPTLLWFSRRFR